MMMANIDHVVEPDACQSLPMDRRKTHLSTTCDQFSSLLEQEIGRIVGSMVQSQALAFALHWLVRKDLEKKRTRWVYAYLPFLSCRLVGGATETAVPVATAWNLLHLAAHLFDDIADEGYILGPEGRMPLGEAVNVATTLLFLAQTALDTLPNVGFSAAAAGELRQQLNQMLVTMCGGQHQDLVLLSRADSDQTLYWQIAAAKTGNFFGWATEAGAWSGGGNKQQRQSCADFGYNLGLLLQIMDDWNDLYSGEGNSDLSQGKRTLPLLYALAVAPAAKKQALQNQLLILPLDVVGETAVRHTIIDLGGLQYVLVQAEMRRRRAQTALAEFPDEGTRRDLLTLLDLAFPFADVVKPGT